MLDDLTAATDDNLAYIAEQVSATSALWKQIRPPWECAFIGTHDDVDAIDYLQYEGIGLPDEDQHHAAAVMGNVIVSNSALRWLVHSNREFYVATDPDEWPPGACVCPRLRLLETFARGPQFGKYNTTFSSILIELLARDRDIDADGKLRFMLDALTAQDNWYAKSVATLIKSVRWLND